MSLSISLEDIPFLEKTCRACSRYDPNDSMAFHPLFKGENTDEHSPELAGVHKEFILWNIDIKPNDGLPQQMCNDCVERFVEVKLFREQIIDSQQLLSSYLKSGSNDQKNGSTTITFETLPMSADDSDRLGYVSPSKLIEYVGSEEEELEENPPIEKNIHEIDYFEESESDFLFNHPNRIESNNDLLEFEADNPKPMEYNANCNKKFEEKSVDEEKQVVKKPQSEHGDTKCDICLKNFRSEHHLTSHKRLFHIRMDFTCPICGSKFEKLTQRSIAYHLKSHHTKKYKCSYCEKRFQQKIHMINHERVHTKEKPFACHICGKKFRQQGSLQEHLMAHDDPHPFKCEICGKGFTHRSGLRMHLRLHNDVKPYVCEVCGDTFHQKTHLDHHMQNHTNDKPFQCEFCPKAFRRSFQLGNHMHTVHFSDVNTVRDGVIECSDCDLVFSNAVDLFRHRKSHDNGERKFLCPQCGADFKQKTNLNLHINAVHLKQKPYNCIYCNKTFSQMSNLNEHIKIHKGSKQHKCSFCDRSFTLRKTLLMHEAIHTGEKRFKCNFCDESFVYRQTLGTHIMNHFRDENEEEYVINEEILGDEDFLGYDKDLDLNEEFKLDSLNLLLDDN